MENSDLIIIAVKPHVVSPILQEVSGKVTREKLFLSIAAGVTLETLEKVGGPTQKTSRERGLDGESILKL